MTEQPIDLSDVKRLAALREARDAERRRTEEEIQIVKWDRAMTRAFKGIFPRSSRLMFMRAAIKAGEVDDA